jgi:holo-[acyl-carrier protein] synthase
MGTSSNMRVGIDLVRIGAIAESLEHFGDRFLQRVFTPAEITYAMSSPVLATSRLAARFAAKEATRKALCFDGIGWRDIEIIRQSNGACEIALHGAAGTAHGFEQLALSMSHEGDYATAVVIADRNRP